MNSSFVCSCPHCGQQFQAQTEWIGQNTNCPFCNKQFTITNYSFSPQPPQTMYVQPKNNSTILIIVIVVIAVAVLGIIYVASNNSGSDRMSKEDRREQFVRKWSRVIPKEQAEALFRPSIITTSEDSAAGILNVQRYGLSDELQRDLESLGNE